MRLQRSAPGSPGTQSISPLLQKACARQAPSPHTHDKGPSSMTPSRSSSIPLQTSGTGGGSEVGTEVGGEVGELVGGVFGSPAVARAGPSSRSVRDPQPQTNAASVHETAQRRENALTTIGSMVSPRSGRAHAPLAFAHGSLRP